MYFITKIQWLKINSNQPKLIGVTEFRPLSVIMLKKDTKLSLVKYFAYQPIQDFKKLRFLLILAPNDHGF